MSKLAQSADLGISERIEREPAKKLLHIRIFLRICL
jgi:hypothetical protein